LLEPSRFLAQFLRVGMMATKGAIDSVGVRRKKFGYRGTIIGDL
jgi:hypothetical protein